MILSFSSVQASAEKPVVLKIFNSQSFSLCSAAKEGFQTQLFKTWVLTQPDFENPQKSISKLEKAISGLL